MNISSAALCEIHRIHRQLSELKSRLQRGPQQVAAGQANVQNFKDAVEAAKDVVRKTRMAADEKELQLKERESRIHDMRKKLNECASNREYQTLQEQIAADEQANSVLSDEILELYEKVGVDEQGVETAEAHRRKAEEDLLALRTKVDQERSSLESDVARLTQELKACETALPGDVKQYYDRIVKSKADDALAELEGEVCGGCFQQVTPQMLNELGLGQFVPCKSCGRILYLPENRSA